MIQASNVKFQNTSPFCSNIKNPKKTDSLRECSRKMKGGKGLRRKISAFGRYSQLILLLFCCVYQEKIVRNDSYRRT